jgi:hypothetical protein
MATFKTRLTRLEAATHKAALTALGTVDAIESRRERAALWAHIQAELGQGPAVDAETEALAWAAAAAMWAAATARDRRLLWALLPLPEVASGRMQRMPFDRARGCAWSPRRCE